MVKEIGQAEVSIPEGYVGNLTDEQNAKLKETWREYFDMVARAKGDGSGGGGDDGEEVVDDPKKAGISKDDKAKEEAKKAEEQKAMNELTEQYGADALRDAFWKFVKLDDPDTGLLRFIRARKWDVPRAIAMFAGCMKWRLDNGVEDLVFGGDQGNSEKIEKFIEQHDSGKVYAYGASVEEHPVCYIHVRKHFTKGQPPETMQKFIAFEIETFRLMLVPPNDKVVLFFDLNGFGLKNMDWSAILYIVKCLEAYFPESLHQLIIYKAPWIFSGIWKILGPMLDPVVRSKVVFMSGPDECKHLLPADRLIEELGGDVKFDGKERFVPPEKNENDIQKDTKEREKRWDNYMKIASEYEEVTKKWANGSDDKELLEKRALLVRKLRVAQFEQDFYQRGKTQLHRDGTLDGQGKVTWIYELKSGDKVRHVVGRRHCCATLKREIKEMEDGKSSKEVEKKSDEALAASNWAELYGSEELAEKLEGKERMQGKVPEIGENNDKAVEVVGLPAGSVKTTVNGSAASEEPSSDAKQGGDESDKKEADDDHKAEAAAGGAAAGGAGVAGAAAAASQNDSSADSANEKFHDAPVAEPKALEKAESKDHVAVPMDEKAAVQRPAGETNGTANASSGQNGSAAATKKSASDYGKDSKGDGPSIKEKTKEKLVDAPKEKTATLGRRFSKLMGKGN